MQNFRECTGEPLLAVRRGGYIEGLHTGFISIVSSDGRELLSIGNTSLEVLLRSCAKPFQLISVLASGAVEKFGFEDRHLAVAAASHSGEQEHLSTVGEMLSAMDMSADQLRCGTHPPFMQHVLKENAVAGKQPEPLHNNCSGKHAAMLAACIAQGWETESYDLPEHPLQVENRRRMASFAGLQPEELGVAVDGCTIPSFSMPLRCAALAYARLADPDRAPEDERQYCRRVFTAMNSHPQLGSGRSGRLEAALMTLFPHTVVAKVGAEALFAVGIAPGVLGEHGLGILIKLQEGITFNRAMDPIVVSIMHQLGLLKENHVTFLSEFAPRPVFDCRSQKAGEMEVLFSLDV